MLLAESVNLLLQWGRGIAAAESQGHLRLVAPRWCFNGAAALLPRNRAPIIVIATCNDYALQWGRGIAAAESTREDEEIGIGLGRFNGAAALLPRNRSDTAYAQPKARRFNGAAALLPRNQRPATRSRHLCWTLQWGRGIAAAESDGLLRSAVPA